MDTAFTTITAADGRRHVVADDGDGLPVVLIHGFPDTPHGWETIAQTLVGAGHRAIRPWLRGYHPDTLVTGRPYDAMTIAQDALDLLDALDLERAVLVGHDWGASIVFGAASLAPERVVALVPIALPHPTLLPRDLRTLWAARHMVVHKLPFAERLARRDDFAYVDALYRRWAPAWHGPERDACVAEVRACFAADPRNLSGALDYYRALSPKLPPPLDTIPDVPALVVGGGGEAVLAGTFERTAELAGEGSRAVVIPGAGHWPHREGEAAFVAALLEFLVEHGS